jgi:hypothetical protein
MVHKYRQLPLQFVEEYAGNATAGTLLKIIGYNVPPLTSSSLASDSPTSVRPYRGGWVIRFAVGSSAHS